MPSDGISVKTRLDILAKTLVDEMELSAVVTFSGEILFDKNGNPASGEEGHGIGTKSIAAFVKKHNALIDYQTDSGKFRLRILLT